MPPVHSGIDNSDDHILPLEAVNPRGFRGFRMAWHGDGRPFQARPINCQAARGDIGFGAQAVVYGGVEEIAHRRQVEHPAHLRQSAQSGQIFFCDVGDEAIQEVGKLILHVANRAINLPDIALAQQGPHAALRQGGDERPLFRVQPRAVRGQFLEPHDLPGAFGCHPGHHARRVLQLNDDGNDFPLDGGPESVQADSLRTSWAGLGRSGH